MPIALNRFQSRSGELLQLLPDRQDDRVVGTRLVEPATATDAVDVGLRHVVAIVFAARSVRTALPKEVVAQSRKRAIWIVHERRVVADRGLHVSMVSSAPKMSTFI